MGGRGAARATVCTGLPLAHWLGECATYRWLYGGTGALTVGRHCRLRQGRTPVKKRTGKCQASCIPFTVSYSCLDQLQTRDSELPARSAQTHAWLASSAHGHSWRQLRHPSISAAFAPVVNDEYGERAARTAGNALPVVKLRL